MHSLTTQFPAMALLATLGLAACGAGGGVATTTDESPAGGSSAQPSDGAPAAPPPTHDAEPPAAPADGTTITRLQGSVDSSLLDRWGATNAVYLFAGEVQPDELDGIEPEPLAVLPVAQSATGCTWRFTSAELDPGRYTLAFTRQGHLDAPERTDGLAFAASAQVDVAHGAVTGHDFAAQQVLRVGPDRTFASVADAAAAAGDGDVIEIDAGVYPDDIVVWRQDNLTVRGVGGRAHLRATAPIDFVNGDDRRNGKGIWVVRGNGFTAEHIEFSGASVPPAHGANGAGIRAEGANLVVCGSYFHDNENGILGGAHGDGMIVEHSEFEHNGLGEHGKTHNIYVGTSQGRLTFRFNYSHHAHIGHNLKSRAPVNYILNNRLMDENDGDASYQVDLPNGGLSYLIGNVMQQGPNADNATLINYGSEGLKSGATHRLYAVHNTLVNDRGAGRFFYVQSGTESAYIANNILVGNATVVSGPAALLSNLVAADGPGFEDRAGFDYRLTPAASAAIDQAIDPGEGDGFSLTPRWEYDHPTRARQRLGTGAPDLGAFELSSEAR